MPQWGNRDQYSDAPKFVTSADTGQTGQDQFGNTVFCADKTEVGVTKGIDQSGWIKRTVGTGGRNGRISYEVLATIKNVIGDAVSFSNTSSANVANSSGSADDSVLPDV